MESCSGSGTPRRGYGIGIEDNFNRLNDISDISGNHKKGNYTAALRAYGEALEINRKVNGPEHSSNVRIMSNMAGANYMEGNYDQAYVLLIGARDIGINTIDTTEKP